MNKTEAFVKWQNNTQEIFDFSVLVHYAVPALKQQIRLVETKKISQLCRPDYYRSHKENYYSDPNLLCRMKQRAIGYKSHVADYLLLSLFSYFEAFVIDIIKEFLEFHGGISTFQSFAVQKSKYSMTVLSEDKQIKKYRNKLKPTLAKNQPDRKHATRELKKTLFQFPSDHFAAYGIYMLGKKIDDLKAKDIPEVLMNVLLIELSVDDVRNFHNIRNIRNSIAHGQTIHLNIKLVTEYNTMMMELARKINEHVSDFFKIYEKYYFT